MQDVQELRELFARGLPLVLLLEFGLGAVDAADGSILRETGNISIRNIHRHEKKASPGCRPGFQLIFIL